LAKAVELPAPDCPAEAARIAYNEFFFIDKKTFTSNANGWMSRSRCRSP
jgi:hypothetical protein